MTPLNPFSKSMPAGRNNSLSDAEVHSISNAAVAHSTDMRKRMIQYGLAMGIRMVCLVLIFVVDGWFKLLMVAGAVFLPWVAVVIANGSDQAAINSDTLLETTPYIELEAPAAQPAPETGHGHGAGGNYSDGSGPGAGDDGPVILQGELVPDDDAPEEEDKRPR